MDEAIAKANTLIEALGYIQQFGDKIVVVKMGGSVMDDATAMTDMLTDVVLSTAVERLSREPWRKKASRSSS